MLTLAVSRLLREAAPPYRHLVTRATGRAVRGAIEAALAAQPCRTACLDFAEVELMDASCADEVVVKLLLAEDPARPVLVLRGIAEEPAHALEHVLEHHDVAIVVMGEEGPALLGPVPPDAQAAFRWLAEHGPVAPDGLAARLAWDAARAVAALERLRAMRVATIDAELYRAIVPAR